MPTRRVHPVYPEQQRRELNRKGFAPILIIILFSIIIGLGFVVYYKFGPGSCSLPEGCSKPTAKTADQTSTEPINKMQKIDLKFKNGSTIILREGKFISTSGEDISGLQNILNSVLGIKIERLFSQSEESIANQKKSSESKTNKELPDLNLFYTLTLPEEANAQNLVARLKSLPLVEDAYIAPEPAPLPAQTDETTNWKTYTDTKDGYQISYPKTWTMSFDPSGNLDIASSDYKKGPGEMTDGIEVVAGTTIRINKAIDSGDHTLEQLAEGVPGSIQEKKEITINNQRAIATDFTYGSTSLTQITVLRKGKVYSIVRMYPPSQKRNYSAFFDQILSTFRFE